MNPLHPGANHELVHYFENIKRPALGWPHAENYIKSSPGIPHAYHMQAHLGTRIGKWGIFGLMMVCMIAALSRAGPDASGCLRSETGRKAPERHADSACGAPTPRGRRHPIAALAGDAGFASDLSYTGTH